jgi:hypothetical protein
MTQRLSRATVQYPGHVWGRLSENPTLEIGAAGEAWISAVRSAWLQAGGTDESFAQVFPQFADRREN